MTCIVGLKTAQGVVIGGDSAGLSGWDLTPRRDPKVFRNGPYIVGFTTSYRMGQVLRYASLPKPYEGHVESDESLHRFMCVEFIPAVRSVLREAGWLQKEKEREDGGTFLVAVAGRLYKVCDDMQVGESLGDFAACGCGWQYAIGALASQHEGTPPETRVRAALEVAERFSAGVRGPFTIVGEHAAQEER